MLWTNGAQISLAIGTGQNLRRNRAYSAREKGCILPGGIIRMGNNSNSQNHSPTLVNLPTVKIWELILPLRCPWLHAIQPC
ncbi:hypothetical protein L1887_29963 [Cichorium endivia]|nr:hypothetical protein L1887_29963 [Cichorium endivia]